MLARQGRPQVAIVVQDDASSALRFAAEELKEHLDRISGGSFTITARTPADGRAIVLGDTAAARRAGIDTDSMAHDSYAIRTVGSTILIGGRDDTTGKSDVLLELKTRPLPRNASRYEMERHLGAATFDFERGTLYGVYRFLEELGVRWFFPGPKGTVIPSHTDLSVQAFSLDEEPVYALRKVGRTEWQWYILDSARLRGMVNKAEYEELGWGGKVLRLWLLRARGSSEWFAFNHRPARMELERRYASSHPEYFALRPNGKRDLAPEPGRTGHLCYTNPKVLDIAKADIDAYFGGKTANEMGFSNHTLALNPKNRGWPGHAIYGRTVSLLPHDSFRGCECKNCLAITHKDRDRPHWHSDLVWQFVVKTARWMERAHPDKLITCLAYASYTQKPDHLTRLPENIVVGLCPANHARTHNIVDAASYAELMRIVRGWSAVNQRPMLIWLHHLYRYRAPRRQGVPMLLTDLFGRLFRDLAAHANLIHVELDPDSIMLEHLNRYVMMKLLYNPNLDPKDLVADYAERFYGPGASIVLPLLRDVEARSSAVARSRPGSIETWEQHFSADVVQGYRQEVDALLQVTRATPHAEAARLFAKYFVGAIEAGRQQYVRHVKEVAQTSAANVTIRQLVGSIELDGELDEAGWRRSAVRTFVNNVDGKQTRWKTELRQLRAPEHLYFAFTCFDPETAALPSAAGAADSVEIFLDPEHDHDSYYWLQIDLSGRVLDWYFEGGREPPDKSWNSGVKFASRRYADRWLIEVKLPRRSMNGGMDDPVGRPWGANFGRSTKRPPGPEDQFSCWSPLLRGRFHQPDLFGHIFFAK